MPSKTSTMLPPPYAHAPVVVVPALRAASTASFAAVLIDPHATYGTRWELASQTLATIAPVAA